MKIIKTPDLLSIARAAKVLAGDYRYLYDVPYNEIAELPEEQNPELLAAWYEILFQLDSVSFPVLQLEILAEVYRYKYEETKNTMYENKYRYTLAQIKAKKNEDHKNTDLIKHALAVGLAHGISINIHTVSYAELLKYEALLIERNNAQKADNFKKR